MNMNKYPSFYILSSADEKNINNNIQENFGVIFLHAINPFIMKSEKTKPEPSLQPSSSIRWNKIPMSVFDTSRIQFSITPEYKYQYQ